MAWVCHHVIVGAQLGCPGIESVGDCCLSSAANPEEIELGDDEDEQEPAAANNAATDGDGDDTGTDVQEKAVPAAVFGSLAQQASHQEGEQGEQLGALERFKKRRVE